MSEGQGGHPGCFGGFQELRRRFSFRRHVNGSNTQGQASDAHSDPRGPDIFGKENSLEPDMHFASCCDFSSSPIDRVLSQSQSPPPYNEKAGWYQDVFRVLETRMDELSPLLRKLSLQIHDHPELMFEERYARDVLTAFMADQGFQVTQNYLGLETAWRAEWTKGTGGRVLGINSEMDALPRIGHACGHNLIAIAGVGVALAVKSILEAQDIQGKIVLLGTPGEEGGGGKAILLERGGYDDMDICMMCHPSSGAPSTSSIIPSLAMQALEVEFFGHTAHASAAPWEGVNALDAAFLAYSSVAVLRQQIKPDHRVHGVVTGAELVANVIPDYTKMRWYVRAPTKRELEVLRDRVTACFDAAALATGCGIKISAAQPYYELRQNTVLSQEFADNMQRYGFTTTVSHSSPASTDFGNVSFSVPSIHPAFGITTEPNGGNHTPAFTAAARTTRAHDTCITIVKGLALTGFRALDDDDFYEEVRLAWSSPQS